MGNKIKVVDDDLKKVSGGVIIPSETWFKCNDCGAKWFTNRPDLCKKCDTCKSTNIERI